MKIKKEILILSDNRPGTFLQSVALAEELKNLTKIDYKIINISYSFLAKLPNFFFSKSLKRLCKNSYLDLTNLDYLPSIVISAGRKTAPIALWIKKQKADGIKVIQIMHPNLAFKNFDAVILPNHDQIKSEKYRNLYQIIGSLSRIDDKVIKQESLKFSYLSEIKKNKITLLLGGSSKKTKFSESDAADLAKLASEFTITKNAVLLIVSSRRSEKKIIDSLVKNLACDFELFDWSVFKTNNPYLALMEISDYFIVSGDSVSMISECCSTGKPIFIFSQNNIAAKKHQLFHQQLYKEKIAFKFNEEAKNIDVFYNKKLDETKRIAYLLKDKFF
jgi:hypothetical protein